MKLFILILAFTLFVPGSWAQAPKPHEGARGGNGPLKVAILPLAIHSPENLDYLREGTYAMFSSRVELEGRITVMERAAVKKALAQIPGEIDSENARKIGEALGADFVVFGSLTKLGDSASVDLKVLEVKGDKPPSSVYAQARKMEEIIAQMDGLARRVDERILGYSLGPAVAEKPAEQRAQAPASPPPVFLPPPSPTAPPSSPGALPPVFGSPLGPRTGKGFSATEFSQSKTFPFVMRGISMGDIDGDGRNELAIIDEKNLYLYRWENNEFRLLKKFAGKANDQFMAVEVLDLNRDGKAEVFVTNFPADAYQPGHRLFSFVVGFRDGDFRIVASELDWFLAAVDWEGKGRVLLGQKKGATEGFIQPIYEIGWDGQKYKEMRKADIPRDVYSVYGFTPFRHEDKTYYAYIDTDFRLKVLDAKGKRVFRSSAYYGSDNAFLIKYLATIGPYQGDEFSFVNVRLVARGDEILVIQNLSPIGNFFKRQKVFSGGEVVALAWAGATFVETWKSKQVSGYLVDFQIGDFDALPGKELIVAVNLPSEGLLTSGESSALMVARVQ